MWSRNTREQLYSSELKEGEYVPNPGESGNIVVMSANVRDCRSSPSGCTSVFWGLKLVT